MTWVRPKIACSIYLKSPGTLFPIPHSNGRFSTGALIQTHPTCLVAKMVAGLPNGLHRLNCMFLDGRLLVDGDLLEVDER